MKILLVEDEEDIRSLIELQLKIAGFEYTSAADGLDGFILVLKEKPDLILLDIMLPGLNGLDVCKKIRAYPKPEIKNIPILFLSAKSEEEDLITGLELGGDDYIPKPFSPKVLISKIKATLRRKSTPLENGEEQFFGDFSLNIPKKILKKNDVPQSLTLSEFEILEKLFLAQGRILTRNQLLDAIQENDGFVSDRNIDVHIASLRKKLGPNFLHIETIRGVGYRFQ